MGEDGWDGEKRCCAARFAEHKECNVDSNLVLAVQRRQLRAASASGR